MLPSLGVPKAKGKAKAKAKAAAQPQQHQPIIEDGRPSQLARVSEDDPQKVTEMNANAYVEIEECVKVIREYAPWAGIENADALEIRVTDEDSPPSGSQAG